MRYSYSSITGGASPLEIRLRHGLHALPSQVRSLFHTGTQLPQALREGDLPYQPRCRRLPTVKCRAHEPGLAEKAGQNELLPQGPADHAQHEQPARDPPRHDAGRGQHHQGDATREGEAPQVLLIQGEDAKAARGHGEAWEGPAEEKGGQACQDQREEEVGVQDH